MSSITLTNPPGNTAGTWTWNSPDTVLTTSGVQSCSATFTPTDTSTYNTMSNISVSVTVSKPNPTCVPPTNLTATVGQALSSITLTNPSGNTAGTWTWNSPDAVLTTSSEQSFSATFIPTDTSAYNTMSNI